MHSDDVRKAYHYEGNKSTLLPESKIEEQVDKESQNNMQLIKYKENLFTKIMKKIKNIINTINNERKKWLVKNLRIKLTLLYTENMIK